MFNQKKQRPEDMTDAEMQSAFGTLKKKIANINKWMPRIAGAIGGIGIATAAVGAMALGVAALPVTIGVAMIGLSAVSLASSAAVRGSYESQIMWLSVENEDRVERAKLAEALTEARNARKPIPQSTLDLRDAFDAAIAEMKNGTDKSLKVGRPLRFRNANASVNL